MNLPAFIVRALLRLHARAEASPYYHLDGYMLRYWVLGYRSPARNLDRCDGAPPWHGQAGGRLYCWLTERLAMRAHTILRSDQDRDLHDHPCWTLSIVLEGGYWEVCEPPDVARFQPDLYRWILDQATVGGFVYLRLAADFGIHWRGPGSVVFRMATAQHRLILEPGTVAKSLFLLGPKSNQWGFYTAQGKVPWRQYLEENGHG